MSKRGGQSHGRKYKRNMLRILKKASQQSVQKFLQLQEEHTARKDKEERELIEKVQQVSKGHNYPF